MEEARRLVSGPLGQELARLPELYAAPIHTRAPNGMIRNGTTFFLNCGVGTFGVTARHVFDELMETIKDGCVCYLGLRAVPFDLGGRLISKGSSADIATYRVEPAEVGAAGVQVLVHRGAWPPPAPRVNQGLVFGGYAGADRRVGYQATEFVGTSGAGIADSINDRDISCLLDRDYMTPVRGKVFPPEGVDLRGMSGGPALALTGDGILGWQLAGIVYECASGLFEMVKIARAGLIAADGRVT